jgi:gliding motility-associated-like protein
MMRLVTLIPCLAFGLAQPLSAQTVIFSNSGSSYTDTDGVTTDAFGPVNVSNCTSISFSVEYNFSMPFSGAGNMESSTECPFGIPPCQGDPTNPSGGGCDQCWDFFYAQFQLNGSNVNTQLVGVPGSTNQSGTLTFGPICTNGATDASIILQTQTWAANETITFSYITITCWDGSVASVEASLDMGCAGQPFDLSATLVNPGDVANTLWTGPGTIGSPANLNTAVNGAPAGTHTYTFTASDDNACTQSSTVEVTVSPAPTMIDPPNITVCAGETIDVIFNGIGNPEFTWTNNNTDIGLDADGTGDISFTTAPVQDLTTATITVTPKENGCAGPSQTFTVTVKPVPFINPHPDSVYCSGDWIWMVPTGTNGAIVNWTNDNWDIGVGDGFLILPLNWGSCCTQVVQQVVANFVMTPSLNGCTGDPVSFTMTMNPIIPSPDYDNQNVCSGEQVDVFLGNPDFTWTNTNPNIGLGSSGTGDISFVAATVSNITTGIITVTPFDGCYGPPQSFTITVNPPPSVNLPSDITVCGGESVNIQFTGSSSTTFGWTNDNTAIGLGAFGNGNLNFTAANLSQLETGVISVTPSISGCIGDPASFTITVQPAPMTPDLPDQTYCSGEIVGIPVTGLGGATIQWTNSNTGIGLDPSGSGDIYFEAATVSTLTTGTITLTAIEDGCEGPDQNFTLSIVPVPELDPIDAVVACAGGSVEVPFLGSSGATFNWSNSNPTIGIGSSGNGDLSFIASNPNSSTTATIVVTPNNGYCVGQPETFQITINPAPSLQDPPDQTVCAGATVTTSFSGTNNADFEWTNNNTSIGLGASGTGNLQFVTTAAGSSTVTVTPSANGCLGPAQSFTLHVNALPSVIIQSDLDACVGDSVAINITGTSGANFTWTNTNPDIGLGASGTGNIGFIAANVSVETSANLAITPSLNGCSGMAQNFDITIHPLPGIQIDSVNCSSNLLTYDISISSSGDAITATAGIVIGSGNNFMIGDIPAGINVVITSIETTSGCSTVQTVNAPNCNCAPVNIPIPANNQSICEGVTTPALTVSSAPGTTVDWFDTPSGGVPLLIGSPTYVPPGVLLPGIYKFYAEARDSATDCTSSTRVEITLTVHPIPSVSAPANITVCAGEPVEVVFTGTNSASIGWSNSNVGVGLDASGNGNLNFIAANSSNSPMVANIMVTPTLNTCVGSAQNFNITVNPTPQVTLPANPTYCAGDTAVIQFNGSIGAVFGWTNSNTAIGLAPSGTGEIDFVTESSGAPALANIAVTPTQAGCTGPTQNFSLIVNPVPSVMTPADISVCIGNAVVVEFMGSNGASFEWTNSNPDIGLPADGDGNIQFLGANPGAAPIVGNLVVTPSQNGCTGASQAFSLTINPLPMITIDSTQCSTDLSTYSIFVNTNASLLTATAGLVTNNGPNYTIYDIPNDTDVELTVTDITTGCLQQQPVTGPNCFCPPVATPTNPNSPEICEGTDAPALVIQVDDGLMVDWYSTPSGGLPLLSGSTSYTPTGPFSAGTYLFYAESRDTISGCTSPMRIPVVLTVLEIPVMVPPLDYVVCSFTDLSIVFEGPPGGMYKWVNSNPGIGLMSFGSGNIDFTVFSPTMNQLGQVTVTPHLGICSGPPETFNIFAIPLPDAAIIGDSSVCAGSATMLSATGGTSYLWSTGETTASISIQPNAANTYTASVANSYGCMAVDSIVVNVFAPTASTINGETCDPALVGTTTTTIIPNLAGCDSIITTVLVLGSSSINAQATAQLAFGQYAVSCTGAADGTVLGSASGGAGQYQYSWSIAGQNSSVLTGVGAGVYGLTVTDINQCTATSSVTVLDPPPFGFDIALDSVGCGETHVLANITTFNGVAPFLVSLDGVLVPGGLTPSIPAGIHFLEVSDLNGCISDTTINVSLPELPTITLPTEASVALGETLVVQAQTNLLAWQDLSWSPVADSSCLQCLTQTWSPSVSETYQVVITDPAGCTASASVRVLVKEEYDLYIPNVFSPNDDGENDFWTLHAGPSVSNLDELMIFDRWGELLFQLEAPTLINTWPGWDGGYRGEPVNPGVYVFYLEATLVNGEKVVKKGDVTLIR